jgi:hypothetical protein
MERLSHTAIIAALGRFTSAYSASDVVVRCNARYALTEPNLGLYR